MTTPPLQRPESRFRSSRASLALALLVTLLPTAVSDSRPSSMPRKLTHLGWSLAVGDARLVVGALNGWSPESPPPPTGVAYVYARRGKGWVPEASLVPEVERGGGQFGVSVTIDGDTIAVGAWKTNVVLPPVEGSDRGEFLYGAGSVYVFDRADGEWRETACLTAPRPAKGDGFGFSLALDGDTLVVGAPSRKASNGSGGVAFVFERQDGAWSEGTPLEMSGPGIGAYFGGAVDVSGDVIAVSAPHVGRKKGAVFVFERGSGGWGSPVRLLAPSRAENDLFGSAISLAGTRLVVGAPGTGPEEGPGRPPRIALGAAYVFERAPAGWDVEARLTASNLHSTAQFGCAVSTDGARIVVGALGEAGSGRGVDADQASKGAPRSGAAYVFDSPDGAWRQVAYLKASNAQEADQFGVSVGVSGELVAVGAPNESSAATGVDGDQADDSANASGAAYVFALARSGWRQVAYLKAWE